MNCYVFFLQPEPGKGFGLERVCGFTGTVFGPGLLVVRVSLHFVLVGIIFLLFDFNDCLILYKG